MERRPLIDRLEKTRDRFATLAARAESNSECSYAPGKWTARQILAHLADCEFINLWRFCRAAAEPGSTVLSFEENQWAARLDYAKRPIAVSRDLFLGARGDLIHHAKTLGEAELGSCCVHPEKGQMSGFDWLALASDHLDHHLGQVEAALEKRPWQPAPVKDAWKFGAAPKPK